VIVLKLTLNDTDGTAVRGFDARAVYGNADIEFKDAGEQQDGDAPFTGINYTVNNPGNLTEFDKDVGAGNQTLQPVIARLVPILVGCCDDSPVLEIYVDHIYDVNWDDIGSAANSTTLKRGDASGDGNVNLTDALIIGQYNFGEKTLDELEPLNASCPNHDGDSGDAVNLTDALVIGQYNFAEKNCCFE
jgi:hypothetical protein